MLDLKNIFSNKISIVGAGKLGQAIAKGFLKSEKIPANQITLTRRNNKALSPFKKQGFIVSSDNCDAVSNTSVVIISVDPQGMKKLLEEIAPPSDYKRTYFNFHSYRSGYLRIKAEHSKWSSGVSHHAQCGNCDWRINDMYFL